jgi:hypothetical protein
MPPLEAQFEAVVVRVHEQVRDLGGRLLEGSPRGVTFDFAIELRAEALGLWESLEGTKSVSAVFAEGPVATFVRGDNWAGSVSPILAELDRLATLSEAAGVLIPKRWAKDAPELWARLGSEAAQVEGAPAFVLAFRNPPSTRQEVVEPMPPSRMFGSDVSGDDLRRLKLEKQKSREMGGSPLCKAALALGLGLSRSGRHREAAFEVLEGLAHARSAGDSAGAKACAAFLSQVARHEGDSVSSDAWGRLAQE